jgi:hypothetical protein
MDEMVCLFEWCDKMRREALSRPYHGPEMDAAYRGQAFAYANVMQKICEDYGVGKPPLREGFAAMREP